MCTLGCSDVRRHKGSQHMFRGRGLLNTVCCAWGETSHTEVEVRAEWCAVDVAVDRVATRIEVLQTLGLIV
jgi:hypothetical protein